MLKLVPANFWPKKQGGEDNGEVVCSATLTIKENRLTSGDADITNMTVKRGEV